MYLAVSSWKRGFHAGCFLCVTVFILCGFEHSIADFAYMALAWKWSLNLLWILLGNALGRGDLPSDGRRQSHLPLAVTAVQKPKTKLETLCFKAAFQKGMVIRLDCPIVRQNPDGFFYSRIPRARKKGYPENWTRKREKKGKREEEKG